MQIIGTVICGKIVSMQGDITSVVGCSVYSDGKDCSRGDPYETTLLYIHTRQNSTKLD